MTHTLFPQLVTLNEETHEYLDAEGRRYMGFSSFCDNFLTRPFNSAGAAYGVAKSAINKGEQMTAQAVLDKWEEQRDMGVRVDSAIELFCKEKRIADENKDIAELVKSVSSEYDCYHSHYNQLVVYNQEYMIAGAIDKACFTSNRKDGQFELGDFKCFERDDNLYEHKGWFFSPMNHMSYTKVSKINIQLSYYAFQLEELTGKRCKKLFIHLINPVTKTHQKIYLPYLKNDLLLLLETHKEKIKEFSVKQQESIF